MVQPTNVQQLYPQPQGAANAVAINIYNPQAYGSAPQQQVPYNYTNSLYQMPNASLYQQPQAYMPAPIMPVAYNQPSYMPMQQPQTIPVAPAPEMMPQSVMTQEVNVQPQAPIEQAPAQQAQAQEAPIVEAQQAQPVQTVDTNALVQELASSDADVKGEAINKIATLAQEAPEVAYQVVSEPIMNSLINIINEDTTALEGPSKEQIAAVEKMVKGEQLTPEETALTEQLSPRDKANKNRIFSLYTLAMIQKLQRDELNEYIEAQKANGEQPIQPLALNELAGYNDIVNVINNDSRPEVKIAAIQALQHVAEPQEKAEVETILAGSLKSDDADVKAAAQEAMQKFAA